MSDSLEIKSENITNTYSKPQTWKEIDNLIKNSIKIKGEYVLTHIENLEI